MMRSVRGKDDRVWTLQADMEWRTPSDSVEFEHDVSSGRGAAMFMLCTVILLAVVLIVWTPSDVVVPVWLVLLILAVILFFPLRWVLRRPWTVVAITGDNGDGEPTEQWRGSVRGLFKVRTQVTKIARTIADESMPGLDGPLKQVAG